METADLDDAAKKICASKIFDNATSCSSENSVVTVDAVYDKAIAALERAGGLHGVADREAKIRRRCGRMASSSRTLIARDADVFARGCGLPIRPSRGNSSWSRKPEWAAAFHSPAKAIAGPDGLPREKISIAAIVRANEEFSRNRDRGHSVGLHTKI